MFFGGLYLSSLCILNFYFYPFDALRPRGGPYFLLLQKVGKDRRKGVSPPCESPDQSGVLDAPLWKPPSLAALSGLAELLAACAAGASVPLGKARARARSPRPPHLHRFVWGLRPLAPAPLWLTFSCPCVPQREKSAGHARTRMGQRSLRLCRQRLRKSPGSSCREAARSSVTPLARLCRRHSSATAVGGIPKGAQPSLASLCLLSAGQKVGARRGPSASKELIKILIGVKRVKKPLPAKCPAGVSTSKERIISLIGVKRIKKELPTPRRRKKLSF